MKNKVFIILLLTTIITPQITQAVWWNPTSWFKQEIITTIPNKDPLNLFNNKPSVNEPAGIEKEIIKIPTEKIITKMIDNPELLKQIITLKAEKDQLKFSLDYASKKITELNVKIETLNKMISENNTKNQLIISSITDQFKIDREQAIVNAIKQGENNQKQKENSFFDELILNVDNPSAGSLCMSDRRYSNILESFTRACKTFVDRNFPAGQK